MSNWLPAFSLGFISGAIVFFFLARWAVRAAIREILASDGEEDVLPPYHPGPGYTLLNR